MSNKWRNSTLHSLFLVVTTAVCRSSQLFTIRRSRAFEPQQQHLTLLLILISSYNWEISMYTYDVHAFDSYLRQRYILKIQFLFFGQNTLDNLRSAVLTLTCPTFETCVWRNSTPHNLLINITKMCEKCRTINVYRYNWRCIV